MSCVMPCNLDRPELSLRAVAGAHEHGNFRGDNVQKSPTNEARIIVGEAGAEPDLYSGGQFRKCVMA
jgi:hypothetical protein